jgi:hypothetical protein
MILSPRFHDMNSAQHCIPGRPPVAGWRLADNTVGGITASAVAMTSFPVRGALPAIIAASFLAAIPQALSQGRTIDLRGCPLDTVTFIDPWAGGEFRVEAVGTNYVYLCGPELREEPSAREDCIGPYGELVLKGSLTKYEGEAPRPLFAVWTVSKSLPCCGWYVSGRDEARFLASLTNFRWLAEDEVPKLGELPFASIDSQSPVSNDDFAAIFGNPKMAMMCELPPW